MVCLLAHYIQIQECFFSRSFACVFVPPRGQVSISKSSSHANAFRRISHAPVGGLAL